MDSQPSNIKKFTIGLFAGLFIAGIFWLYSIYFHVPVSLVQEIIGASLLAISCGIVATVSGIDKLFDNFPNI